ncbi:hypothetical protein [Sphingomonas sp. 3F27F9]|uniref:hypothetical protein n=1 Tax=unclassified Sphingomonas TaxID=196159 RepID=UPI0010F7AADA|nr:hypothetical protein [Sphingomonas sp. 3F27F9]
MVIGILISITAIGILCWLLFTLAIYALPLFAGVAAGSWAYEMGAGWPGGILAGLITAGLTLGLGQFLFTLTRPAWLRLAVGLVFAAPAALAGYHAVHGIAKHAVPSETWQTLFSIVGAVAVGITAWTRIAAAAPARSSERFAGA